MNKVVVIVGPTASGKTELALRLCQRFKGEIVSVDSRQAYRGMGIGTGKATTENGQLMVGESGVPIHLYDLVRPNEPLNAFDYTQAAQKEILDIINHSKVPFLVGGSGFYLAAVLGRRQLTAGGFDPKLRAHLENLSREELVSRLESLGHQRIKTIDTHNRYRLIRAVEIAQSGVPFTGKTQNHNPKLKTGNDCLPLMIGLTSANSYLYRRVDERIDRMVEGGLVEEVEGLVAKYGWKAPGLKTLGYTEFGDYFEGKKSLVETIQKIKFNTHAYIRRQKTYFKKYFPDVFWFDIGKGGFEGEVESKVESFLDN